MSFADLYDGFIFDYGGVLVCHQTRVEQDRMAKIAGMTSEQFDKLYWTDRTDYDKGLVTGIEYWTAMGREAGLKLSPAQISDLIESDSVSWMNFDEPMWTYIEDLRRVGKRVAILSNMPYDLGEALKARTQRLQVFDHITLSYEIKSVKPEAAIYEHCLAGLGTQAGRTVFFDDKIANVKGAEMLGMSAVEFLDSAAVLNRIRA